MNTIKMGQDRKAANARRAAKSEGTTRAQLARKIAGTVDVEVLTKLADCGQSWVAKRAANKLECIARKANAEANALAAAKEKRSEAAKKAAATRKAKKEAATG